MTRDIKRNPWAGLLLAAAAFLPARAAADTCDQNFNFINPSSWWGGAFGNCKRPGGPTDPEQVFECAYDQVDQNRKSQCLHDKLRASPQTGAGIDAAIANNAPLSPLRPECRCMARSALRPSRAGPSCASSRARRSPRPPP